MSDRQTPDMHEADVANGENPDEAVPQPPDATSGEHPTGTEQAAENSDNDPPA